jgi:hypothetical protein
LGGQASDSEYGLLDEAAKDHQGSGQEQVEVHHGLALLGTAAQFTEAIHPGMGPLDGLVTNDKFCLTRHARRRLRWRGRGGCPPRAAHG